MAEIAAEYLIIAVPKPKPKRYGAIKCTVSVIRRRQNSNVVDSRNVRGAPIVRRPPLVEAQ